MSLKWEDPPRLQYGTLWVRITEELRSRPNEWAMCREYAKDDTARKMVYYLRKKFPSGYEFRAVIAEDDGLARVYARYTGDEA